MKPTGSVRLTSVGLRFWRDFHRSFLGCLAVDDIIPGLVQGYLGTSPNTKLAGYLDVDPLDDLPISTSRRHGPVDGAMLAALCQRMASRGGGEESDEPSVVVVRVNDPKSKPRRPSAGEVRDHSRSSSRSRSGSGVTGRDVLGHLWRPWEHSIALWNRFVSDERPAARLTVSLSRASSGRVRTSRRRPTTRTRHRSSRRSSSHTSGPEETGRRMARLRVLA